MILSHLSDLPNGFIGSEEIRAKYGYCPSYYTKILGANLLPNLQVRYNGKVHPYYLRGIVNELNALLRLAYERRAQIVSKNNELSERETKKVFLRDKELNDIRLRAENIIKSISARDIRKLLKSSGKIIRFVADANDLKYGNGKDC